MLQIQQYCWICSINSKNDSIFFKAMKAIEVWPENIIQKKAIREGDSLPIIIKNSDELIMYGLHKQLFSVLNSIISGFMNYIV